MRLRSWLVAAIVAVWACTTPNPDFDPKTKHDGGPQKKDGLKKPDGVGCVPRCKGRECGPDGCNGSCGICPGDLVCSNGHCLSSCKPDCDGKECGPDGCGGTCGPCADQLTCDEDTGRCIPTCTPDCKEKDCGPDGCGGICGMCGDQLACDVSTGKCVAAGCGAINWVGCCAGQLLTYCENGKLKYQDCAKSPKCGWDFNNKFYNCGTSGYADPTGNNQKKCP